MIIRLIFSIRKFFEIFSEREEIQEFGESEGLFTMTNIDVIRLSEFLLFFNFFLKFQMIFSLFSHLIFPPWCQGTCHGRYQIDPRRFMDKKFEILKFIN